MAGSPDDLGSRLVPVTELSDPRLADYRDVREADLVQRRGSFIAESEVVLRALVAQRRFAVRSVLLSHNRVDKLRPLLVQLPVEVPVFVLEPALMNELVGFKIHRGVLAVGAREAEPDPRQLLGALFGAPRLVVGLEGLTNHDNVGGVFRNAAAFGADAVLLDDRCCDPLYRKAIRVSVGSVLRMPYARCRSAVELLELLHQAGLCRIALSPRAGAIDISEFGARRPVPERAALLLGTEGPGLSDRTLERADLVVRIPIESEVDSLNVATSSGIALHAFRRARRDYTPENCTELNRIDGARVDE